MATFACPVFGQDGTEPAAWLLPKPKEIAVSGQAFSLKRSVRLNDPTGSTLLASLFKTKKSAKATVTVRLVSDDELGTFDYALPGFENEGYRLSIAPNAVTITAGTRTGVIRAAQTLMQLAAATDGARLPGVTITDYPAFKLRGFMHDVGRSFISFEELKREIDLLARFKVNAFHWHLTDNQAFRFESKAFPQLNEAAYTTRFAGSYYTQTQCTELGAYAAERGMVIIPEIDMPGHSRAFTAAMGYPMSSPQGRAALKTLLAELATAFPRAPYLHIGADEAGTTAEFINEMTAYIHQSLGRRCVVWNPISGVSISTATLPHIDMTEMWSTAGRKIDGLPNIDCRYNYVNHFDVFADLVGIYRSNIYYFQQGSPELAGAISAVWNDRKLPAERDIIYQNNLYANVLATAERGWMGGGQQYIEAGGTALPLSGSELEEFRDWERRFLHYKDTWLRHEPIPYVRQTDVRWRITAPFPNGGDASAVFPPETATADPLPHSYDFDGETYGSTEAVGAAVYLRHTWGTVVPGFYEATALNTTAYAWTYVYSPKAQEAGALIEFQNYSRSENDRAPDVGQWDRKGSRIWLNGVELLPPAWENSGRGITSETDLLNENFAARQPLPVHLHHGWNKVLLKLPYVAAAGVRLNKWLFTFVLTTPDGRHALPDIIYSPDKR
ncbi:MAG: beta-N-acetylhexosaminidase [Bacteroidaceae bacterium]|nr:beta-N-acetylhexosaminidase [Bacteroidaceae bacterium]MBR1683469.1 beta-N-acetylhexosaminidase [Bacteroidaceae bacterium]